MRLMAFVLRLGLAVWLPLLIALLSVPTSDAQEAALVFDGVDEVATIPQPAGWPSGSASLTVEAWLKPSDVSGTSITGVVWGESFGFTQNSSDHSILGFLISRGPTVTAYTPSGSLVVGEWAHFAGTFDGSTIGIYKNGQFVNSEVYTAPGSIGFFTDLLIGLWPAAMGFAGTIDEVRIWNTVRTEAQLRQWMNKPLSGTEPDLLGYWRLDEGAGQMLSDSTALANDGVLGSSGAVEPEDPLWTSDAVPIVAIFEDGFEDSTTSAWSATVGG